MEVNFEFSDLPDWDHLAMHLLEGRRNAVTQRHLSEVTGIPLRALQEALEAAKRAGECVVTGNEGVWLSFDWRELQEAYRRDRSRALKQLVNTRGRLKAIARLQRVEAQYHQEQLPWKDAA